MKLLIVILISFMFFGCLEEGTIVYDQDYPEAPENLGGSGSGADRVPGDGAGSAGGTSDGSGSGSTAGSSDGNGSDGSGSTGTSGDGAGTDGSDTSNGSSDGSGSTGDGTGDGSTGGADGTGSGTSSGDGSGDGSSSGSGDGSSTGTGDGSGDGSDGGSGTDGGVDGEGDGSTGGDGNSATGSGTGGDSSSGDGSDGGDSSSGDGSSTGTGDSNGTGSGTEGGTDGGTGDGSTGDTGGDGSDGGSGDGTGDGSGSGDGGTGDGTGTGDGSGTGGEPEVAGKLSLRYINADADAHATVSESGTTDKLKLKLNTAPTHDVVVTVSSVDTGEMTASPAQMTFTPSNWDTDQIITVTGVADNEVDENQTVQVRVNSVSADDNFNGLAQHKHVVVENIDVETSPVDGLSTTVAATAGAFQNTVSWSALDGAEGYTVYYSTSNPAFPSGLTTYVNSSNTSFVHNGLDAGTTYFYQVVATHKLGDSDASNVASGTPYADLNGVTPAINADANGTDITVTWNAIEGAESYRLYYSTVAPAYPGGAAVEVDGTSYTLFKPEVETTYYFQVRAIATGGNSHISNMAQAIVNIDCPDCGDPEVGAPTITVEADVAKNILRWDAVTGADSYKVYWDVRSFSQGTASNVETTDNVLFTHNALDSNKFYFYRVSAVDANGNEFYSNLVHSRPHATECNAITPAADNDPDLLAYYAFEGNLNDAQGNYHLTTLGGGIGGYANNCITGSGGYFDGKGGYGYNLDFSDEHVNGLMDNRWSISVWANADEDMNKFASIISTTAKNSEAGYADGWDNGFQIDVTDDMEVRVFFSKTGNDPNQLNSRQVLTKGEWNHFAVTYDNGALKFFINGIKVREGDGFNLGWNRLKVGVNRFGVENWKGFIDDLKVFGRTLTPTEVIEEFEGTLPAKVQNVAALNLGEQIGITWDAVEGVNTYRVYYSTSGNPTVSNNFFQVQNANATTYPGELAPGVTYYFRVAAVNNIGAGELSDATNESSTTIAEDEPRNPETAEPVYVDTKIGFHYPMDYVRNANSSYNPPWYNSRQYKVNEPNMGGLARLIVAAGDKVKEHGMHINQYKTTITIDDVTSVDYKRQIDVVDKNAGWSYFNYTLIVMDQSEFNNFATRTGRMECFGRTFTTIAEYTTCNPEWVQAQKDLWERNGGDNTKMLNDFIPVKNGYYTIEVKKYRGSQHYNYAKYDGVRNYTIVTQQ